MIALCIGAPDGRVTTVLERRGVSVRWVEGSSSARDELASTSFALIVIAEALIEDGRRTYDELQSLPEATAPIWVVPTRSEGGTQATGDTGLELAADAAVRTAARAAHDQLLEKALWES